MWYSVRRIQSGSRPGRSLSRQPHGTQCANLASRITSYSSTSSLSGHAARIYFNVRRLCHTLSQRGADDVGHAGLQLRPRQAGISTLTGMRASCWRPAAAFSVAFGDATGTRHEIARLLTDALAGRRCAGAPTRPADRYMGAHGQALHDRPSKMPGRHRLKVIARASRTRSRRTVTRCLICNWAISCRCATIPAYSSTPCIRWPDRAHGYCVDDNARALLLACALNERGSTRFGKPDGPLLPPLCSMRGIPIPDAFATLWVSNRTWLEDKGSKTVTGEPCGPGECARKDSARHGVDGGGLVCRSPVDRGGLSLASRHGLHASRPGRLLRRSSG